MLRVSIPPFRTALLAALLVCARGSLVAQPAIQWQKCFGGTGKDYASFGVQTSDDGFIFAGWTNYTGELIYSKNDSTDAWVVKLSSTGSFQWQQILGGSYEDLASSIIQTTDGGYIFAGRTMSNDRDVSGNHGFNDAWVVKLNDTGKIQWQKCYGGTASDDAHTIIQTSDGGYIFCGSTFSNDGDVSGNHGGVTVGDAWVVKLDSTGSIQWQKCLGGSQDEYGRFIIQTSDGGYILVGETNSNDGDVSGNHGDFDAWVVKLNDTGNILWQKCLGGSKEDWGIFIIPTADGGYALTGHTYSNDGDVTGNHGGMDSWTVKLSSAGAIQWQKCLGGSKEDWGGSIIQTTDGNYVIAGYTQSNDGDVCGNHGSYDAWVVKLDSRGSILSQKCVGGTDIDAANSIIQSADGGCVLFGYTQSNDGDVSGNHGEFDVWVVKLGRSPEVSTRDVSTDTIGGSVYVPIIAYADPISKGLNFTLTYDTSLLIYQGSVSHSGAPLDSTGSWQGHAEVRLDSAALSDDTLAGYAVFTVSPGNGDSSTLVTFDSLPNTNPCASVQSVVASRVGLPHGCGISMIGNFMRYRRMPYFSITQNPTHDQILVRYNASDVQPEFALYNILGNRVMLAEGDGSGELTLNVASLPAGMYELMLRSDQGTAAKTVMIAR